MERWIMAYEEQFKRIGTYIIFSPLIFCILFLDFACMKPLFFIFDFGCLDYIITWDFSEE